MLLVVICVELLFGVRVCLLVCQTIKFCNLLSESNEYDILIEVMFVEFYKARGKVWYHFIVVRF